ncbi:hypothetical protein EW145_g5119 [Phellinidium pouzarii]|uniref:Uncharacterized protein n=1 Tax=Phellinidium pouzarii TaxID=167371 RepID=A0A4S4L197_9AGAM|nr:hypothetical protein EW145_g5119 [Phellinidium pouzarii]
MPRPLPFSSSFSFLQLSSRPPCSPRRASSTPSSPSWPPSSPSPAPSPSTSSSATSGPRGILYPTENLVWKIGYTHHVVWDLNDEPAQITNPIGQVWLRKNGSTIATGPGSIDEPLASGFNLTDGRVLIRVPDVEVGCDYQLVLFGDSGNFSPKFIIAAEGD